MDESIRPQRQTQFAEVESRSGYPANLMVGVLVAHRVLRRASHGPSAPMDTMVSCILVNKRQRGTD